MFSGGLGFAKLVGVRDLVWSAQRMKGLVVGFCTRGQLSGLWHTFRVSC